MRVEAIAMTRTIQTTFHSDKWIEENGNIGIFYEMLDLSEDAKDEFDRQRSSAIRDVFGDVSIIVCQYLLGADNTYFIGEWNVYSIHEHYKHYQLYRHNPLTISDRHMRKMQVKYCGTHIMTLIDITSKYVRCLGDEIEFLAIDHINDVLKRISIMHMTLRSWLSSNGNITSVKFDIKIYDHKRILDVGKYHSVIKETPFVKPYDEYTHVVTVQKK